MSSKLDIDPFKGSQAREKLEIARQKKDAGDKAFKARELKSGE